MATLMNGEIANGGPQIRQVEINHGDAQRSSITSISILFDRVVDIDDTRTNPFTLIRQEDEKVVNLDRHLSSSVLNLDTGVHETHVDLQFASDPAYVTPSMHSMLKDTLLNGTYLLVVNPLLISSEGNLLNGDTTNPGPDAYVFGDDPRDDFFRLFGDANGDGVTDFNDFTNSFLPAFGGDLDGTENYVESMDFDRDSFVDFNDFASGFLPNFGSNRQDPVDLSDVVAVASQNHSVDFNGDGFTDSLRIEKPTGTLMVSLGGQDVAGSGRWFYPDSPQNWNGFRAGDFNGDGRDDLAFHDDSGQWHIAFSESTRFVVHTPLGDAANDSLGSATNPNSETLVGDFDGDGSDELIGRPDAGATTNWTILEYDTVSGFTFSPAGYSHQSQGFQGNLVVEDANRDGRDDLIGTTDLLAANNNGGPGWFVSLSSAGASTIEFDGSYDWSDWFDGLYQEVAGERTLHADGPLQFVTEQFAKVYNEVELELYYGIRKGPTATLESRSASPMDQAAALTELLSDTPEHALMFDPQLATGTITVSVATIADWLGANFESASGTYPAVGKILKLLDESASVTGLTPSHTATFRHSWVRVKLPSIDPR